MPGDGEEVITQPVAENTVETDGADPRDGANKGIVDRLNRLERKFEREKLAPVVAQLDAVKARLEEQGLDLALFGFEDAPQASKPESKARQEQEQTSKDNAELLKYKAAMKYKLPEEALPLVTATTEDGIEQQVKAILMLNPQRRRSPIMPGPDGKTLPTFTRSQLRDGQFFKDNQAAIQQALKDGRVVDDITQ